MRIFYDTEFLDDGDRIDLISIGMVAEDGRELYAVSNDFDQGAVKDHPWLSQHVWPHLPLDGSGPDLGGPWLDGHTDVKTRVQIASAVREFITAYEEPQLWAWYAAYDHVALAQLFGPMVLLPEGVPMWTNDLKQEAVRLGLDDDQLPEQTNRVHHALDDARHDLVRAQFLDQYAHRDGAA